MSESDLKKVFGRFAADGEAASIESYGSGHINDTYLVRLESGDRYIMQRINDKVFRDVPGLMQNIVGVTEYIADKLAGTPDAEDALKVIRARNGGAFVAAEEGYFRLYNFISGGVSIETKPTPDEFRLSAVGFGRFQKLLDGYPADKLNETIADFHNTRKRLSDFRAAVRNDRAGRASRAEREIEFFLERERYASVAVDALNEGRLPKRVTHNDTKLNNVLVDAKRGKAVAVIDLDTVMPGSLIYDFGDSIRFGASTAAEDERDLNKVAFSPELFDAYARGFLGEVADRLSDGERELLAFGAVLMTYECGMRFLADYLDGDVYFKVRRDGHNLDRARTQIKLVSDMEKALPYMRETVEKYSKAGIVRP